EGLYLPHHPGARCTGHVVRRLYHDVLAWRRVGSYGEGDTEGAGGFPRARSGPYPNVLMPVLTAPALTRFAEDILLAAGVPAHKASLIATSLVASNLRGVDSHGVQLVPFYIDQLLAGE